MSDQDPEDIVDDIVEYADQEDLDELEGQDPENAEFLRKEVELEKQEYAEKAEQLANQTELDKLLERKTKANESLANNEISLSTYNEEIVEVQKEIVLLNLKKLEEGSSNLPDLRAKADKLLREIEIGATSGSKLDAELIYNDIDKIFRNSAKQLEKNVGLFVSNELNSNISNVLSVPISELNIQKLNDIKEGLRLETQNIREGVSLAPRGWGFIEDYLRVKELIVLSQSSQYGNDILYFQFIMDLRMLFSQLRSFLHRKVNLTDLTPNKIDKQVVDLVAKYQGGKGRLFEGSESEEIRNFMKKLASIQIFDSTEKEPKFKAKFTREEIREDFERGDPAVLNKKYAKYQDKMNFIRGKMGVTMIDQSTQDKWERIVTPVKYKLFSGKEVPVLPMKNKTSRLGNTGILSDLEMKEIKKRSAIKNILVKALELEDGEDIWKNCVASLNIRDPDYQTSKGEDFIHRLYTTYIPVMKYSTSPNSLKEYAKSVDKMADEFFLNKTLLESSWNQGVTYAKGDKVIISQNNVKISKLRDNIYKLEDQLREYLKINDEGKVFQELLQTTRRSRRPSKVKTYQRDIEDRIQKWTAQLELLEKGNIRSLIHSATFIRFKENSQAVVQYPSGNIKTVPNAAISRLLKKKLTKPSGPFGLIGFKTREKGETKEEWNIRRSKFIYPEQPTFDDTDPDDPFDLGSYDPIEASQYWQDIQNDPDKDPFVTLYTPIPNELYKRLREKSFGSLFEAVKKTPLGSFFHLKGGNPATELAEIIEKTLSPKGQKRLLYRIVGSTGENLYQALFSDLTGKTNIKILKTVDEKGRLVPKVKNPRFQNLLDTVDLLENNHDLIDHLKYIDPKIDPEIRQNFTRVDFVVLNLDNETIHVSLNDISRLQKIIRNHILDKLEWIPSTNPRIQTKIDPETGKEVFSEEYFQTINWNPKFNPTFQIVPLEKNFEDSIIVPYNGERYRIRFADPTGTSHKGWMIREKGYKYPMIIIDFKEYLERLRNKYIGRIEHFSKIEVLTNTTNDIIESFRQRIEYISEYLNDNFIFKIKENQQEKLRLYALKRITSTIRLLNDLSITDEIIDEKSRQLEEIIVKSTSTPVTYKNSVKYLINYLLNNTSANDDLMSGKSMNIVFKSYGSPNRTSIKERQGPPQYILKFLQKKQPKIFKEIMGIFSTSAVINPDELFSKYDFTNFIKQAIILELNNLRDWRIATDKIATVNPPQYVKNAYLAKVSQRIWTSLPNISFKKRYDKIQFMMKRFRASEKIVTDIEGTVFNISEGSNEEYDKHFKNLDIKLIINEMNQGIVDPVSLVRMVYEQYEPGIMTHAATWESLMKGINKDVQIMNAIKKTINSAQLYRRKVDYKIRERIPKETEREEFYYVKDSQTGEVTKKTIDENELTPEQKRSQLLMSILKYDYQPRIWDAVKTNLQEAITDQEFKNRLRQIRAFQGATEEELLQSMKDIDRISLSDMSYNELQKLSQLVYKQPSLMKRIPIRLAVVGVYVCPAPQRGMFLVGGTFPVDPRSYRFRNTEGELSTKLVEVCKFMGISHPEVKYPENTSMYSGSLAFETEMIKCVTEINKRNFKFKVNNDLSARPEYIEALCSYMGIKDQIMKRARIYWERYGGDPLVFPSGGSEKEYKQLVQAMMYDSCIANVIGAPPSPLFANLRSKKQNLLLQRRSLTRQLRGVPIEATLTKYRTPIQSKGGKHAKRVYRRSRERFETEQIQSQIAEVDYQLAKISRSEREANKKQAMIDVSVLHTESGETIYRQVHFDKTVNYPIPTGYDYNGFPIYSGGQVHELKWLVETGTMGPWLTQHVRVTQDLRFEGDVPFKVNYDSNRSITSNYYVEQTFRDSKYGMPIVCRIGIQPKKYQNVRRSLIKQIEIEESEEKRKELIQKLNGLHLQSNIVQKMPAPIETFVTNNERTRIEYYLNKKKSQSEASNIRLGKAVNQREILEKGGYALLDSRSVVGIKGLKYDPVDVWSWDPLKDRKAKAQNDSKVWNVEKNKLLALLKEQLQKYGATSSAFIGLKNRFTQDLENFRVNLPSQVQKLNTPISHDIKTRKQILPAEFQRKIKTDPEFRRKMNIESWMMTINYSYNRGQYAMELLLYGLVQIPTELFKIIEDPRILFPNYNRSSVYVYEYDRGLNGLSPYQFTTVNKYLTNQGVVGKKRDVVPDIWETIGEIIYNMSYTRYIQFPEPVQKHVDNDFSQLSNLSEDEYLDLLDDYPIMEILTNLYKKKRRLTLWNILEEVLQNYSKNLEKTYIFEEPIEIGLRDVINYLGDSFQQNTPYSHNSHMASDEDEYLSWLYPGCIYAKIQQKDNITPPNEFGISELEENSYIKVFQVPERNHKHYAMYTVGHELHKSVDVSENLARRAALFYDVNVSELMACASLNAKRRLGKIRRKNYAIDLNDVMTYLSKGRQYYTYYELPNEEIDLMARERVIIKGHSEVIKAKKKEYVNMYRKALNAYFEGNKDEIQKLSTASQDMRVESVTLDKLVKEAIENEAMGESKKRFIENLDFTPDFKDPQWPSKKKELEFKFMDKIGIPLESFLESTSQPLRLNIPSYDELPEGKTREIRAIANSQMMDLANIKDIGKLINRLDDVNDAIFDLTGVGGFKQLSKVKKGVYLKDISPKKAIKLRPAPKKRRSKVGTNKSMMMWELERKQGPKKRNSRKR